MLYDNLQNAALVTLATGKIVSVEGGRCTVEIDSTGPSGSKFPRIMDCRIIQLTGSGNTSGLNTYPSPSDSCLVLFNGYDLTEPLVIPSSIGKGNESVSLYHRSDVITLTGNGITIQSPSVTIKSNVTVQGNITVSGTVSAANVSASNSISHGGTDIGKGHRHNGVESGDKTSGGVV